MISFFLIEKKQFNDLLDRYCIESRIEMLLLSIFQLPLSSTFFKGKKKYDVNLFISHQSKKIRTKLLSPLN
jgi:hypothetical protein